MARSLNDPGSPSAAFTTTVDGSDDASPATVRHFSPVRNPAPPRPRSPDSSTSPMTASGVSRRAAVSPTIPSASMYASSEVTGTPVQHPRLQLVRDTTDEPCPGGVSVRREVGGGGWRAEPASPVGAAHAGRRTSTGLASPGQTRRRTRTAGYRLARALPPDLVAHGRREGAPREPAPEAADEPGRAEQAHRAAVDRVAQGLDAAEHAQERKRFGVDDEIGVEPGVLQAHRRVAAIEHHPDRRRAPAAVRELDDHTLFRQRSWLDAAVHPPRERDGINLRRQGFAVQPTHGPLAERDEDGLEVLARWREVVLAAAPAGGWHAIDDAHALQVTESLGEQRAGDAGRQRSMSLNRVLPRTISRTMSGVHRSATPRFPTPPGSTGRTHACRDRDTSGPPVKYRSRTSRPAASSYGRRMTHFNGQQDGQRARAGRVGGAAREPASPSTPSGTTATAASSRRASPRCATAGTSRSRCRRSSAATARRSARWRWRSASWQGTARRPRSRR